MLPELEKLVGVLILCAKPEEQTQISKVIEKYFSKDERPLLSGFPTYKLPEGTAGVEEVLILANCGEMANVSAASRTGYLTALFAPNLVIFVGSAGSLYPDICKIRDVVVPLLGVETRYYDKIKDGCLIGEDSNSISPSPQRPAHLGAYTNDKQTYELRLKTQIFRPVGIGNEYVSEACGANSDGTSIKAGLECHGDGAPPKIHIDAKIFSWDMVLASGKYRDRLIEDIDRKSIAVDMESYGFLSTLHQFSGVLRRLPISGVIVRGISDDCGNKTGSQERGDNNVATRNAANVACRIVRDGYLKL